MIFEIKSGKILDRKYGEKYKEGNRIFETEFLKCVKKLIVQLLVYPQNYSNIL